MKKLSLTVLGLGLFMVACNKYPEGPKLSLLSKKSRLAGEWKLEKALVNGVDQTSSVQAFLGNNYVWSIKKDGSYTQTYGTGSESGKWAWYDKKEKVIFTPSTAGSTADTFEVTRLKSKSLWFRVKSGSDTRELHLKQ